MPKTKKPLAELGTVFVDGQSFYAHFQYNNDEGERKHIYGPQRDYKQDAQADLDQIRAAGQVGDTREEGLSIMHAEAQRIMPRTKRPLAELGAVSADGRSFYASPIKNKQHYLRTKAARKNKARAQHSRH